MINAELTSLVRPVNNLIAVQLIKPKAIPLAIE